MHLINQQWRAVTLHAYPSRPHCRFLGGSPHSSTGSISRRCFIPHATGRPLPKRGTTSPNRPSAAWVCSGFHRPYFDWSCAPSLSSSDLLAPRHDCHLCRPSWRQLRRSGQRFSSLLGLFSVRGRVGTTGWRSPATLAPRRPSEPSRGVRVTPYGGRGGPIAAGSHHWGGQAYALPSKLPTSSTPDYRSY